MTYEQKTDTKQNVNFCCFSSLKQHHHFSALQTVKLKAALLKCDLVKNICIKSFSIHSKKSTKAKMCSQCCKSLLMG